MLYIKDLCGVYQPAPKETILSEARKLSGYQFRRGTAILSPTAAKEAIGLKLTGLEHEVFGCLFLDSRHQVLAWREMFRGSINRNSVHPREVVKLALQHNAAGLIFAHNHPSGVTEPSQADEALTRTLKQALALVDVRVLDHFIVAGSAQPLSFAERGLL